MASWRCIGERDHHAGEVGLGSPHQARGIGVLFMRRALLQPVLPAFVRRVKFWSRGAWGRPAGTSAQNPRQTCPSASPAGCAFPARIPVSSSLHAATMIQKTLPYVKTSRCLIGADGGHSDEALFHATERGHLNETLHFGNFLTSDGRKLSILRHVAEDRIGEAGATRSMSGAVINDDADPERLEPQCWRTT